MAKEEKFTFLSADGKTTIHAVKWIPEDGKYEAILQITHGMIEFVERYRLFAEFLSENGFMVPCIAVPSSLTRWWDMTI